MDYIVAERKICRNIQGSSWDCYFGKLLLQAGGPNHLYML